ncbi:uncharacterized protein [Hetaerina americana]|uniref:uncharacterized protein n=1 Tax=Hetaerina americana TaxID=62018 RepID=UPI003A7F3BB9
MNTSEFPQNGFFKSYVVYDLETTTLPSFGIAKIIELSAIGVIRDHILDLSEGEAQPRVLNKITLCVNPRKMLSIEAERLTGLSNILLETSSPFDECMFGMLEDFINRLPRPVCLIAHNGNGFDFPILQSEIQRLGKKFEDHVWCADSLLAFRYIYLDQPRESFIDSQSSSEVAKQSFKMENMLSQFSEMDSVLCDALASAEKAMRDENLKIGLVQVPPECTGPLDKWLSTSKPSTSRSPPGEQVWSMQMVNETTPKRPVSGQFVPKVARVSAPASQLYYTPVAKDNGANSQSPKRKVHVKSLIKEFNDSLVDRPTSFKLADIYTYVCRKPCLNVHSAESDTVMLMQSIVACRSGFLPWVDKNAVPFNAIKPCRC